MFGQFYEGKVTMIPEIEKSEYVGEDEITYKIPKFAFGCTGEVNESTPALNWSEDSVFVMKDNRIVKYTEYNTHKVYLTDDEGHSEWLEGRAADIIGFEVSDTDETVKEKSYWIEEDDLEKSEKRKYKVTLEECTTIDYSREYQLERIVDKLRESNGIEYILTDPWD